MVVKTTVAFDRSIVPVDKYDAWRGWVQRVDALLHKSVRLVAGDEPVATRGAQ
jgi:hypothetical protein